MKVTEESSAGRAVRRWRVFVLTGGQRAAGHMARTEPEETPEERDTSSEFTRFTSSPPVSMSLVSRGL